MKHGLGLSPQATSQHLEVLESTGLVSSKREGRYRFHHLDPKPLTAIVERWSIGDRKGG
jgi:DNA-binding transcriptional ArsR family regulator